MATKLISWNFCSDARLWWKQWPLRWPLRFYQRAEDARKPTEFLGKTHLWNALFIAAVGRRFCTYDGQMLLAVIRDGILKLCCLSLNTCCVLLTLAFIFCWRFQNSSINMFSVLDAVRNVLMQINMLGFEFPGFLALRWTFIFLRLNWISTLLWINICFTLRDSRGIVFFFWGGRGIVRCQGWFWRCSSWPGLQERNGGGVQPIQDYSIAEEDRSQPSSPDAGDCLPSCLAA